VDPLLEVDAVLDRARAARAAGATRFCMGAAWRNPKPKQLAAVAEMIRQVRALGLETCATLGMLKPDQARELSEAGLDYYNHNLDTSEAFYPEIITTRSYADRLETLQNVRDAGLKLCCGGILGMGESREDRVALLHTLATLPAHPESVPINQLVRVPGTPLEDAAPLDPFEFIRTIAVARILMPGSHLRLSAGRSEMSEEMQALAFFAGANSVFYGEKLLTTPNPDADGDMTLFRRLGLKPEPGPAERTQGGMKGGGRLVVGQKPLLREPVGGLLLVAVVRKPRRRDERRVQVRRREPGAQVVDRGFEGTPAPNGRGDGRGDPSKDGAQDLPGACALFAGTVGGEGVVEDDVGDLVGKHGPELGRGPQRGEEAGGEDDGAVVEGEGVGGGGAQHPHPEGARPARHHGVGLHREELALQRILNL